MLKLESFRNQKFQLSETEVDSLRGGGIHIRATGTNWSTDSGGECDNDTEWESTDTCIYYD